MNWKIDWKEIVGLVSALVAITAGGLAIYDHFQKDEQPVVASPPQAPQITVLARTAFNDSGRTYVEDFNGAIIPLNGSIRIVYIA